MSQQNVNTAASESKESSSEKPKRRAVKKSVPEPAVEQALQQAETEHVPLSRLVISPLNARKHTYPQESVTRLARTIQAVGLLQNLVVHTLPDGFLGVGAGGRRLAALQLLLSEGVYQPDQPIPVKRLPESLMIAASMTENEERVDMHPVEQIAGFGAMAAEGKSPAQIGDLMGYSTRHVQRCLRLADLAPGILDALSRDELTLDHCQALTLTDSHERQLEVWMQANDAYHQPGPNVLRQLLTTSEVAIGQEPRFAFVGREAYEAAGGAVRLDLFSDEENGYVDAALIERLTQEKLSAVAAELKESEGWAWTQVRTQRVWEYTTPKEFHFLPVPAVVFTDEEQATLDVLKDDTVQALAIREAASLRSWAEVDKSKTGAVLSLVRGEVVIQRGLVLMSDMPATPDTRSADQKRDDAVNAYSAALVKSMFCERTLAVQAELCNRPDVSVALLTWHLCFSVFSGHYGSGSDPMKVTLHSNQHTLTQFAASGESGKAWLHIAAEKTRWEARLPAEWNKDFLWLLNWSAEDVSALLGFCSAHAVCGMQERLYGKSQRSPLDLLETAMGFDLTAWWTPDAQGFFKRLTKDQITDVMNEAGMSGAARDAAKMSKGDAADHAELTLKPRGWVPAWMKPAARADNDSNV